MHRELERTMRVVEEDDYGQGFWEIRQYACRNRVMHCGILDELICGNYEEVSECSSPSILRSSIPKSRDGILILRDRYSSISKPTSRVLREAYQRTNWGMLINIE